MFEIPITEKRIFRITLDEHLPDAFFVRVIEGVNFLSELHLVPLWPSSQFTIGDYYQRSFSSYPPKRGYGKLLIETLLKNHREAIPILNSIYSTSWDSNNNAEQNDFITVDAADFWKGLVKKGLAESINPLARFRMLI